MDSTQLDYQMKPETFDKLNEVLTKGKIELRKRMAKTGIMLYVLSHNGVETTGVTICSAIEAMHKKLIPPVKEITIEGIVYVPKESQNG